MQFFRSIVFYLIFYLWTILYFLIFSQVKYFSHNFTIRVAEFWSVSVMKLAKWILLIEYKVLGERNIPKPPFIIASNHQSAWETFFFPVIFSKAIYVLKKDLKKIPIFKSYFKKLGFIYVDKNSGFSSIKSLLLSAKKSVEDGVNSIIIFPEGTRVSVGEEIKLNAGVSALYKNLSIPVLPISHNSGDYWLNKSLVKKRGTIVININPIIKPGLEKDIFHQKLKKGMKNHN